MSFGMVLELPPDTMAAVGQDDDTEETTGAEEAVEAVVAAGVGRRRRSTSEPKLTPQLELAIKALKDRATAEFSHRRTRKAASQATADSLGAHVRRMLMEGARRGIVSSTLSPVSNGPLLKHMLETSLAHCETQRQGRVAALRSFLDLQLLALRTMEESLSQNNVAVGPLRAMIISVQNLARDVRARKQRGDRNILYLYNNNTNTFYII